MSFFSAEINGKNWRVLMPALFLLLAAALGGLRDLAGWAVFSALFAGYLLVFERDFSFSLTLPLGLLVLWLAAGLYFSPEPLNSFWHFSKYLVFLAFFALARTRGGEHAVPALSVAEGHVLSEAEGSEAERAGKIWAGAVLALGCLAAACALFERALGVTPAGIIGANPNYGGAFMAAGLAAVAAAWPGKSAKARLWHGAAAVLLAAGILAANSRGAFMAAAVAVFFALWLRQARRAALYLAGALLLAAALVPADHLGWFLKLRDPRSFERFGLWKTAFEAIAAQPVFGAGLGLFERAFELFKFPFYNGISYYGHSTLHAHGELLNIAAEAGLPAAVLLAWAWSSGVLRGRASAGGAPEMALKGLAFALFAQAAVDIVFYSGAVQLCFFGTLGLLAGPSAAAPPEKRVPRAGLYLFAAALAAALLLKGGFERDRVRAALVAGIRSGSAAPVGAGAGCIQRALRFSPGEMGLRKAAVSAALDDGNFPLAAALADDAALRYPKDPFLAEAAAEAYYGGGDAASAKDRLLRALALEPNFLSARLGLVQLLAREKDFKAAAAEFGRLETSIDKAMKANRPRPKTAYDRALLWLPQSAYEEIRLWKKRSTGGTTASTLKKR